MGILDWIRNQKEETVSEKDTWEVITKDGTTYILHRNGVNWKIWIQAKGARLSKRSIFSFGPTAAGEVTDLTKYIGKRIRFDAGSEKAEGITSPIKSVMKPEV